MRYNIQGGIQYGGDYVRLTKLMGGILSTYANFGRGGLCPGGILSYTRALLLYEMLQPKCLELLC